MFFVLARISQCASALMIAVSLLRGVASNALYVLIPGVALFLIGTILEWAWFKHGGW